MSIKSIKCSWSCGGDGMAWVSLQPKLLLAHKHLQGKALCVLKWSTCGGQHLIELSNTRVLRTLQLQQQLAPRKGLKPTGSFFYLQVHKYEDTCSFSILTLAFKFTFQWEWEGIRYMGKQPSGPSTLSPKFEVTVSILQSIYMVSSLRRQCECPGWNLPYQQALINFIRSCCLWDEWYSTFKFTVSIFKPT